MQTEILTVYNVLLVTLFTKCTPSSTVQVNIKVIIDIKRCQSLKSLSGGT